MSMKTKNPRKVPVTIHLDRRTYIELKKRATYEGRTMSSYVFRMLQTSFTHAPKRESDTQEAA